MKTNLLKNEVENAERLRTDALTAGSCDTQKRNAHKGNQPTRPVTAV